MFICHWNYTVLKVFNKYKFKHVCFSQSNSLFYSSWVTHSPIPGSFYKMILCYTCQFWVLFYGNCNQIMKWHKTLFKGFFFHFQANSLVFDLSMPKRQTFKNFKSCVVHHFLYPFLIFYFFSPAVCVGFKFSLQNSHQNNKESVHFFFHSKCSW